MGLQDLLRTPGGSQEPRAQRPATGAGEGLVGGAGISSQSSQLHPGTFVPSVWLCLAHVALSADNKGRSEIVCFQMRFSPVPADLSFTTFPVVLFPLGNEPPPGLLSFPWLEMFPTKREPALPRPLCAELSLHSPNMHTMSSHVSFTLTFTHCPTGIVITPQDLHPSDPSPLCHMLCLAGH